MTTKRVAKNELSILFRSFRRKMARGALILRDRLKGVDFLTVAQPSEVGCDPRTAYRSSPSGNHYLERVLASLRVSAADSIIDIGCGKGSAMRTMLKFEFGCVGGIELSKQLADRAIKNFTMLGSDRWRVFNIDATRFDNYGDYNMYYFYNPFPASVMSEVLDRIVEKLGQKKGRRGIKIIYNNPVCHQLIVDKNVFSKVTEFPDEWGNGIYVYASKNGFV